jgi:hypothetical protein
MNSHIKAYVNELFDVHSKATIGSKLDKFFRIVWGYPIVVGLLPVLITIGALYGAYFLYIHNKIDHYVLEAIMAALAIIGAILTGVFINRLDNLNEKRMSERRSKERKKALLVAFYTEIKEIFERYIPQSRKASNMTTYYLGGLFIKDDPFHIYKGNVDKIGELNAEIVQKIIHLYLLGYDFIETIRAYNHLCKEKKEIEEKISAYLMSDKVVNSWLLTLKAQEKFNIAKFESVGTTLAIADKMLVLRIQEFQKYFSDIKELKPIVLS